MAFLFLVAVLVDYQNIRFQEIDCRDEIHDAATFINISVLYIAYRLDHEEAFVLVVKRAVAFVVQDGVVGADSNVQVAILRSLTEELNVPRVKQIITS